jgi:hypothetical protein
VATYYDPIHGRLKLIVKNSGGYDFNFHISKVAEENNIDIEIVREIFLMTTNEERRDKFVEDYKNGVSINDIRKINNMEVHKSLMCINSMMAITNNLSNGEWY